jgi:phage tail sheath protein FI
LWLKITRDITLFLNRVYATGALFGATSADAFFVKCDAETNPPEVIDAGQVICEIGIAPTKPAEFVIFRVSQYAPGAEGAA